METFEMGKREIAELDKSFSFELRLIVTVKESEGPVSGYIEQCAQLLFEALIPTCGKGDRNCFE
jgi:hypothetical protein